MPFLRKYNTLLVTGTTSIRIPIIKRAVVDFALGADWTPAAGDVKVFVDAAAAANITNLPTAIASGNGAFWEFILTAAELSCKQLLVVIADAATKAVEDQSFIVETYGNASAMYAADLSLANLPANVTQLLGTAWLAPGTAGTPDVNVKLWNALTTVALPLIPTTAGRTLDVSATGEAGLDWANIGSPTTAQNLSATNIDVDQIVASVSGAVGSVTGAVGSVTGAVGSVTGAVGSVTGAVGSVTGAVGSVTGAVGSVTAGVSVAVGGIAATSFAAGAIDAGAIAADAITSSELAQSAAQEIADEVLNRDIAGGASGNTRNVRNALRAIRNKVSESGGTLTVTQEDDITAAWTATVIRTAATNPITSLDPV